MLSADDNKPIGKSAQRKRKKAEQQSGAAGQRNRKSGEQQSSKLDHLQDSQEQKLDQSPVVEEPKLDELQAAQEQVAARIPESESLPTDTQIESAEVVTSEVVTSEVVASEVVTSEVVTSELDTSLVEPITSAETVPVGLQTIANAYGDYTRKSFEQTKFLFEKLAGVRSLDKAFELQANFVKQACDTFIADSQRIRELHRDLAKQRLVHLEGFVAKMTQAVLVPRLTRS